MAKAKQVKQEKLVDSRLFQSIAWFVELARGREDGNTERVQTSRDELKKLGYAVDLLEVRT